ncbi:MAG: hypothetical protein LBR91_01210 [Puniceicoccales bacterium]|nr:hypothetical protein [Puniceicoccales bacterium]
MAIVMLLMAGFAFLNRSSDAGMALEDAKKFKSFQAALLRVVSLCRIESLRKPNDKVYLSIDMPYKRFIIKRTDENNADVGTVIDVPIREFFNITGKECWSIDDETKPNDVVLENRGHERDLQDGVIFKCGYFRPFCIRLLTNDREPRCIEITVDRFARIAYSYSSN